MKEKFPALFHWQSHRLIPAVALFLVTFYNFAFFRNMLSIYPLSLSNIVFVASIAALIFALITVLLTLLNSRYTLKPVLYVLLPVSALASYFMDSYNVVIDTGMIENIVSTNVSESSDLFSFKLVIYFILLGILPAWYIYQTKIEYGSLKQQLLGKSKLLGLALAVIVAQVAVFSKTDASFFREHKIVRYYSNPITYVHSAIRYLDDKYSNRKLQVQVVGTDANIPTTDNHRELLILVIGETARADRFSLNGYHKKTNPLLEQENVISYSNVMSCGTATAISVPCMFSKYGRDEYKDKYAEDTENLLDVLHHAGVNILWRDNNSDSKHVAERIQYEDYKSPHNNTVCDDECRDEGMLVGLQEYINQQRSGDIVIVLHSMGNHGPAYYKRYPAAFEKFTPACHSNELQNCSNEEINNAYDNAILYTDYFLAKVIALLKQNDQQFEAAMLYMSDHGESLGENNIYLHGLPYAFAPDTQKHVGNILWLGSAFADDGLQANILKADAGTAYSHDNLFHTVLGLLEIESDTYNKKFDILARFRHEEHEQQTRLSQAPRQ